MHVAVAFLFSVFISSEVKGLYNNNKVAHLANLEMDDGTDFRKFPPIRKFTSNSSLQICRGNISNPFPLRSSSNNALREPKSPGRLLIAFFLIDRVLSFVRLQISGGNVCNLLPEMSKFVS